MSIWRDKKLDVVGSDGDDRKIISLFYRKFYCQMVLSAVKAAVPLSVIKPSQFLSEVSNKFVDINC